MLELILKCTKSGYIVDASWMLSNSRNEHLFRKLHGGNQPGTSSDVWRREWVDWTAYLESIYGRGNCFVGIRSAVSETCLLPADSSAPNSSLTLRRLLRVAQGSGLRLPSAAGLSAWQTAWFTTENRDIWTSSWHELELDISEALLTFLRRAQQRRARLCWRMGPQEHRASGI